MASLPVDAVDQHEFADRPTEWLDGPFRQEIVAPRQRDVGSEPGPALQTARFGQGVVQPSEPDDFLLIADQDQWPVAPSPALHAVEIGPERPLDDPVADPPGKFDDISRRGRR